MNPQAANSSPAAFGLGEAAGSGLRCDIYCSVIDNFGDAGISWRLARQLTSEHGWSIRLWIDRPDVLQRFAPQLDLSTARQSIGGVEVVDWRMSQDFDSVALPDVVVEAFGCRLPGSLIRRMADRRPPPVWINLEYLSAEDWIGDCHTLPSRDPATGLAKHFFFPGFKACGGLLRERGLGDLIREFDTPPRRRAFIASLGIKLAADALPVTLFCYPDSPIPSLLDAWRTSSRPVHCIASQSLAPPLIQNLQDAAQAGLLRLSLLPFLSQDDYDRLLLSSEVNFVRGEDSFVRAQWARQPFVWQPYRQEAEAHRDKLKAFLDKYLAAAPADVREAVSPLSLAWGTGSTFEPSTWLRFAHGQDAIRRHNQAWAGDVELYGDLATHLAIFCKSRL